MSISSICKKVEYLILSVHYFHSNYAPVQVASLLWFAFDIHANRTSLVHCSLLLWMNVSYFSGPELPRNSVIIFPALANNTSGPRNQAVQNECLIRFQEDEVKGKSNTAEESHLEALIAASKAVNLLLFN